MAPKSGQIDILQVLRGFAAILIVIFHSIHDINEVYFIGEGVQSVFPSPHHMIYGIDLFFVLSGFIMVYTTWGQSGFETAKYFFKRRLIRIVPLYWFYTVLLAVIFFFMPQVLSHLEFNVADFLRSLFFIPYYDHEGGLYPFLKVGWTLNYEMYFYLVFAVCLLLPARYQIAALSIFFLSTVFLRDYVWPEGFLQDFYGRKIILNFLVGAWIGYLFCKNIRLPGFTVWIGYAIVCISILWILNFEFIRAATGLKFPPQIFACLSLAFLALPKGTEDNKFSCWSVFLGNSSYTLYLMHSFTIAAIVQCVVLLGWQAVISPWILFLFCVSGAIIGGSVFYLLIEKPLLTGAKRLILKSS